MRIGGGKKRHCSIGVKCGTQEHTPSCIPHITVDKPYSQIQEISISGHWQQATFQISAVNPTGV